MNRRTGDRGTIVVCVLVCLLIVSGLVAVMTQTALRSRREVRRQHQMRQTELLLDAGVLRAVHQLTDSTVYAGETWSPHEALSRHCSATVEISVDSKSSGDRRRVQVTAIIDAAQRTMAWRTRRSHTFLFNVSEPFNAE